MSEETKKNKMEQLQEKRKATQEKRMEDATRLISTRSKIEGDYDADLLKVSFDTSSETHRTILARRPTNKEMITIMKLSAEAAKYEGSADPEALIKMVEIYERLSGIASKLSVDETLDEEFWNEKVSFSTLQNFITELITESQKGTGVTESELKKFRK